jgi:hypothetical protein
MGRNTHSKNGNRAKMREAQRNNHGRTRIRKGGNWAAWKKHKTAADEFLLAVGMKPTASRLKRMQRLGKAKP